MRHALLIALLAATTSATQGAFTFFTVEPTVGLADYDTYTLFLETTGTETLRGFDANITGNINHVNPFGVLSTVFTDNNAFLDNDLVLDVSQDSQFLFASGDVLSIGAEEGDGFLRGAISGLARLNLPNPTPIVQIATNDPGLTAEFAFDLGTGEPFFVSSPFCFLTSILEADLAITSAPAPGLPGQRTYTVGLENVVANYPNISVEASFDGPMFQADGAATPFVSDLEAGQSDSDSHFLLDRGVLTTNTESAEVDTPAELAAQFRMPSPSGDGSQPLAQITTGDPASVQYEISLEVCSNLPPLVFRGTLIPEPTAAVLLAFGAAGAAFRARLPATSSR